MKIELELPEWTDERHIFVVAGEEPVAYRMRTVDAEGVVTYRWYYKTGRCNLCGKCCMNLRKDWIWGVDDQGTCLRLVEINPGQYYCDPNKGGRPWDCLKGDGRGRFPDCTVCYKEI